VSARQPANVPAGTLFGTHGGGSLESSPASGARRYDPATVFAGLNDAITRNEHHLDVILGAIAVAAQSLTQATGAAIAMWKDSTVVCRARSGESAPPLGARLSADSGISGECLRSGQIQICNDTDNDVRVDAEVCRVLGLRSISALPIQGWRGINGILEVFSTEPRSFTEEHIAMLQKLAALAERARASQPHDASPIVPVPVKANAEKPQSAPQAPGLLPASDRVGDMASAVLGRRWRPFILATVCVLGLLLGVAIWLGWHSPDVVIGKTHETRPAAQNSSAARPPDNDPIWKISPSAEPSQAAPIPRPSPLRLAAKLDLLPGPATEKDEVQTPNGRIETPQTIPARSVDTSTAEPPPSVTLANASVPAALNQVLSSKAAMPGLGPSAVSQGISDGYLVHSVTPVYPPQAWQTHVEGAVVLEALISEDGHVRNLKVKQGPQLLARAALDAVQQWRYKPYQLDGKPVAMSTTITVRFKLP